MLQAIRDRVTGWIAVIIIGLLAVTFALWGVDSYLKSSVQVFAAKVNDAEISSNELGQAVRQYKQRLQAQLGQNYNPAMFDDDTLRAEVLNRMIEEELLVQAADKAGFAISDGLLAARIQSMEAFQTDGSFDGELYRQLLAQQGFSPAFFEQQMRRSLLLSQITGGISSTVAVTEHDVESTLRLQNQQRQFTYASLPRSAQEELVQVSDADVEAEYKANAALYVEPEQARFEYLELRLEDVMNEINVDDEQLRQYYEDQKHRFATEEERRASHILIQAAEDAPAEEIDAARSQAQELLDRVRNGEDLAALAAEYSDDPGSAGSGGDLGYFGKGLMVAAFEEAAFAMTVGDISELVRSPFGFHIIELTDVRAGDVPPLAQVAAQLKDELAAEQAETLFLDYSETLAQYAFEHPDSLDAAAEALELEVQESEWVSMLGGGTGVEGEREVLNRVFSDEVLNQGVNSEPVEIAPNHLVVVHILDHKQPEPLPLAQVSERIRADLIERAVDEALSKQGEELLARLRAGERLADVAAELGLEVADSGLVGRAEASLDRNMLNLAFAVPHPPEGGVSVTGGVLPVGDYAVVEVSVVQPGDLPAEEMRLGFRRQLERLYGGRELSALVEQLRSQAEIIIREDE